MKTKWEFLKKISEKELKSFLSSYNIDKTEDFNEIFEIQDFEDEFRIELYNLNIVTQEKTKISYIDFLSDFSFYVECIGEKSKKYDSKFLTRELIKLFLRKFGSEYVEKYLDDYKTKLEQKDDKIFSSLFELRTFTSINLSNNKKCYRQAKKLHERVCKQTKQIVDSLYNETEKYFYSILKETEGKS